MNDNRGASKPARSVDELLKLNDYDFVECAYLSILGRPVDAEGLANYLQHVRAGADRLALIRALATSPEGARLDQARLPGLKEALQKVRRQEPSYIARRVAGPVMRALRPLFARMDVCEYRIGKLEELIHLRLDEEQQSIMSDKQNPRSRGAMSDEEWARIEQLTAHARSVYFQLKDQAKGAAGTARS